MSSLKADCTCPSGDGSLRYPCPSHSNENEIELKGKCELYKNKIGFTMCSALIDCDQNGIGDINIGTRTRFHDQSCRMTVTAGRFRKDKVLLNFCPFCGGDIRTEHPQLPEEQPPREQS